MPLISVTRALNVVNNILGLANNLNATRVVIGSLVIPLTVVVVAMLIVPARQAEWSGSRPRLP